MTGFQWGRVVGLLVAALAMAPLMGTAFVPPSSETEPSQTPAMQLSMEVLPERIEVFPTKSWTMRLKFLGTCTMEKYRPDEILVEIQCTVDSDWMVMSDPQMLHFTSVGTLVATFEVSLLVPSMTVGPLEVTLEVTGTARIYGRTLEASDTASVAFVKDPDEFMSEVPRHLVVTDDGAVQGWVHVYNLMDREMEFHICALGEWGDRLPDLDFMHELVLGPKQMRKVGFRGNLEGELEEGEYTFELALWTPGQNGTRNYITSQEVTLEVTLERGSVFASPVLGIMAGGAVLVAIFTSVLVIRRVRTARAES